MARPRRGRTSSLESIKESILSGRLLPGQALVDAEAAGAEGDRAAMSVINRRFHRALYAGCGNPLMIRILDDLRDQTALITVAGWGIEATWAAELREHRSVLHAAERGDADRAAELMREHITTFAARVVRELPEGA